MTDAVSPATPAGFAAVTNEVAGIPLAFPHRRAWWS